MTAKTLITLVIGITIAFLILVSNVYAEEVLPKKKPIELKIQTTVNSIKTWANNEWIEIVEFQKTNWQQGKEQTANNFKKIKSFLVDKTSN